MGKSTISTGPFSIAFCMFTRGYSLNISPKDSLKKNQKTNIFPKDFPLPFFISTFSPFGSASTWIHQVPGDARYARCQWAVAKPRWFLRGYSRLSKSMQYIGDDHNPLLIWLVIFIICIYNYIYIYSIYIYLSSYPYWIPLYLINPATSTGVVRVWVLQPLLQWGMDGDFCCKM